MPYYSVIEGEGVAGPLHAVTAETTTLLSCMGIVFHNTGNNRAGLYHYGANTIHLPFYQNTIIAMFNDIQPTDVYVTAPPVASAANNWVGSTMADQNQVDLFLLMLGANVQWMPPRVWSNYVRLHGNLAVNQPINVGGGTRRYIDMATQMPSPNGRPMGNTTFYGGLGPRAPGRNWTTDDMVLLDRRRATGANVFG